MIKSLFGKLLLSHVAIILVSMLTLGLLMSYLVRDHVIENKRRDLLEKGKAAVDIITPVLAKGQYPPDRWFEAMGNMAGGTIWLMDKNGQVLAGQAPQGWRGKRIGNLSELWDKADWLDLGNSGSQKILKPWRNGDPAIVAALPLPSSASGPPTALFLYSPLKGVTRTTQALGILLLYSLAASALVAMIVGFLTARGVTRPLRNISQAAAAFAAGNYASRTTATQSDEIGELGRTFNVMASELAQLEQKRREFLSDVSHEIKTPVASIQALAEAMLDGLVTTDNQRTRYLTGIVEESNRINRLIGDLLDLSQLEAGELRLDVQPIQLAPFIANHTATLTPFLDSNELTIDINIPATLPPVMADPDRLAQILTNLLTNAIRHAVPGSVISLSARPLQQQAAIDITNIGQGISPEHLPYIWQRFYRVDKSRSRGDGGTGLGLAITQKLVMAMGGTVSATSTPGETTTFTFTLPVEN